MEIVSMGSGVDCVTLSAGTGAFPEGGAYTSQSKVWSKRPASPLEFSEICRNSRRPHAMVITLATFDCRKTHWNRPINHRADTQRCLSHSQLAPKRFVCINNNRMPSLPNRPIDQKTRSHRPLDKAHRRISQANRDDFKTIHYFLWAFYVRWGWFILFSVMFMRHFRLAIADRRS